MANVLYVDDEDPIRRAMRSWLTRRGHVVFTAASIDEARGVLDANAIDGVFIDIWLGNESGFDLFEWIDMHHHPIGLNVVFVTGDILRDEAVERTLAILERPVLIKPFELAELENMIQSWTPS